MPHGLSVFSTELQCASLDHAIWFHRPIKADDWLLYSSDSPSTSGARGFSRGSLFDVTGNLVASTTQEGVEPVEAEDVTAGTPITPGR